MGFGAALAMGLVQGFTKNIEEEKLRRESDYQKLDNLDAIMTEAALKGDVYNSNIIGAAIRDARGELDAKERIGIFGKATPRVSVDMTELAPLLAAKPDDSGTISYFDGDLSWKPNAGIEEKMTTFNSFFNNVANQQRFREAPLGIKQEIMGHFYPIQGLYTNKLKVEGGGNYNDEPDVGQFAESELQGMWFLESFGQNNPELFKIGNGQNLPQPVQSTSLSQSQRKVVTANIDMANNRGDEFTTMGLGSGVADDTYSPILVLDTELYAQGIDAVTSSLGEELPTALAAWQNVYSTKLGFSLQQSKEAFEAAVMFANMSVNELGQPIDPASFDPQEGLQMMSAETISPILKKLYRAGIQNVNQIGLVLAPYMQYTPPAVGKAAKGRRTTASSETLRKYILRTEMGVDTSDEKGVETAYTDYVSHAEGVMETNEALGRLYTEVANAAASDNNPQVLELFFDRLETVFSLDGGMLGGLIDKGVGLFTANDDKVQITNDSGRAEDADVTNNKELTSSYNAELRRRVREAGDETAQRIEAMKITLAFKMARADDPSGRLSNQDIEAQYIKLGRAFSTRGQELAALQVTMADFKRKTQKIQPILALLKKGANEVTNSAEFQLVDGIIAANTMILTQELGDVMGGGTGNARQVGGLTAENFADAGYSAVYPSLRMTLNSSGVSVYYNENTGAIGTNPRTVLGDANAQTIPGGQTSQSSISTTTPPEASQDEQAPVDNTTATAQDTASTASAKLTGDTHHLKMGPKGSPVGDTVSGYIIINKATGEEEPGTWLFKNGEWVSAGI